MTTDALPLPEYPVFSIRELILQGNLLLASSGKEFTKPTGILSSAAEVKKARKEAMGRLGLEFLETVADDIGLDKEFAADMEVDMDENPPPPPDSVDGIQLLAVMDLSTSENQDTSPQTRSVTPTAPSPTDSHEHVVQEADVGALSARERNRLKRKRKPGNSAFVVAPPPQSTGTKYSAAPSGSSHK
jgi:TATA-binding protein-associated factor